MPVHGFAHPIAGILVTLALLCGLMAGLRFYCIRCRPHPELVRKLLHVGMGLVTLGFPWLFTTLWPVVLLAALSAALLAVSKVPGPLRRCLGGVADGVERRTYGDLYFPIAVAALFWLSDGDKLLYCVPILLLTLADAVAALVGIRFGRRRFTTGQGDKTAEGSLACFVVALLCTLVPWVIFRGADPERAIIIAVIVAVVTTLLEAVAWSGLDNLFVPLGGFLLLKTLLTLDIASLQIRLLVTLGLLAFVVAWRRRTTLNDSAVLGAALYGYCAWTIGGSEWLFAPILLFVGYPLLWPKTAADAARRHTVSVVFAVGAAGLCYLFLAREYRRPELIYLYNISFGAQMAMIGLARLRHRFPRASGWLLVPVTIAVSWMLLIGPALLLQRLQLFAFLLMGIVALAALIVATVLFDRLRLDLRHYPCDSGRWRLQAILGGACSIAGTVPFVLWNEYPYSGLMHLLPGR